MIDSIPYLKNNLLFARNIIIIKDWLKLALDQFEIAAQNRTGKMIPK